MTKPEISSMKYDTSPKKLLSVMCDSGLEEVTVPESALEQRTPLFYDTSALVRASVKSTRLIQEEEWQSCIIIIKQSTIVNGHLAYWRFLVGPGIDRIGISTTLSFNSSQSRNGYWLVLRSGHLEFGTNSTSSWTRPITSESIVDLILEVDSENGVANLSASINNEVTNCYFEFLYDSNTDLDQLFPIVGFKGEPAVCSVTIFTPIYRPRKLIHLQKRSEVTLPQDADFWYFTHGLATAKIKFYPFSIVIHSDVTIQFKVAFLPDGRVQNMGSDYICHYEAKLTDEAHQVIELLTTSCDHWQIQNEHMILGLKNSEQKCWVLQTGNPEEFCFLLGTNINPAVQFNNSLP